MDSSTVGGTNSMKEYLKRYESRGDGENNKRKKKSKKKLKGGNNSSGVIVVDRDPVWQKPLIVEEDQENDSPDEKPVVDEDIEVKRMKRLEIIRARRAYNSIADDGSGWVSLSPKHNHLKDDIDISPPRRLKIRSDTPSPEGEQTNTNPDHMKHDLDDDLSPPRKRESGRYDSDDLSPPRKRNRGNLNQDFDEDLSPPRKSETKRHDADDFSLPRNSKRDHVQQDDDLSPPRKRELTRYDSHDLSPPGKSNRGQIKQELENDLSPPRKTEVRRHQADDFSPPRRINRVRVKQEQEDDLSPPRKSEVERQQTYDFSPPRKSNRDHNKLVLDNNHSPRKRETKRNDVILPRRRSNRDHMNHGSDADVSPPKSRKPSQSQYSSPPRKGKPEPFESKPPKASSKAGLLTGSEMRDEILKTKKEDKAKFEMMDPSLSGKGAQAIYRDKKGNKISKEEHTKLNQKVEEKPKEKKIEWGKGLAQKREAEEKLLELELEKEKPFARTRDDPELDAMLKERVRWGDPMAHLVKKKARKPELPDLGDSDKMKQSGFIVPQDVPAHSWIKRGIDAATNRYGIRPGRHWDGVDRSTGFEKQLFKRTNEKRASESEAYIWSVADM